MKIFWSWQSDTPGRTGRHLVRAALLEAITRLKVPQDVEEPPDREVREALHLDQDRQGISGSPDLARTIFNKIDAAAVFVADVTPVSKIPARGRGKAKSIEKRNMNPNVAIELGYALKSRGDENVLMVLNTYYGDRKYLPFDLAHKAGPILFDIGPSECSKRVKDAVDTLTSAFVVALRPFVQKAAETRTSKATPLFREAQSTLTRASYFEGGEVLATIGETHDHVDFGYNDGDGCYLRLFSTAPRSKPFMKVDLVNAANRGLRAMWRRPSGLVSSNRYGAIVVEPDSVRGGPPKASTQLFTSGEMWGFSRSLFVRGGPAPHIPGGAFERTFIETLRHYVHFADEQLKISPPYIVEMGAVGIKGMSFVTSNVGDHFGPFHDNEVVRRLALNNTSETSINEILLLFFEEVFAALGYPRPTGLFGFPPLDGK